MDAARRSCKSRRMRPSVWRFRASNARTDVLGHHKPDVSDVGGSRRIRPRAVRARRRVHVARRSSVYHAFASAFSFPWTSFAASCCFFSTSLRMALCLAYCDDVGSVRRSHGTCSRVSCVASVPRVSLFSGSFAWWTLHSSGWFFRVGFAPLFGGASTRSNLLARVGMYPRRLAVRGFASTPGTPSRTDSIVLVVRPVQNQTPSPPTTTSKTTEPHVSLPLTLILTFNPSQSLSPSLSHSLTIPLHLPHTHSLSQPPSPSFSLSHSHSVCVHGCACGADTPTPRSEDGGCKRGLGEGCICWKGCVCGRRGRWEGSTTANDGWRCEDATWRGDAREEERKSQSQRQTVQTEETQARMGQTRHAKTTRQDVRVLSEHTTPTPTGACGACGGIQTMR